MSHHTLIVENEPDIQMLLQEVLEGQGYATEVAGDGLLALART